MVLSRARLSRIVRAVSVTLAILFLAYAVREVTLYRAVPSLERAKARVRTHRAEIQSLTARLEASKAQQKIAEQEAGVIRRANQLLREQESNRQAEVNRLQSELDFYKRLAGTSGTQSGLAVYHLELSPTASDRVFQFVLTLTQNLRRSAIVSGNVRIDLEGTMLDRPVTLPWSQVTDGSQPEPEFRFKYFQQLQGYLALPENFEPTRLLITLEAKGQSRHVSRGFQWSELTDPTIMSGEASAADRLTTPLEKELEQGVPANTGDKP